MEGKRARIVVFANEKGGCCKSTSVEEVSACMAGRGFRVLAVDLDGQKGALSWLVGADREEVVTSYDVLQGDSTFDDAVQHLDGLPFDIVASDARLDSIAVNWNKIGWDTSLKRAIEASRAADIYDFILIDTPGALNGLTMIGACAADWAVIPVNAEVGSIGGMTNTRRQVVGDVHRTYGDHLRIAGVMVTRFAARENAQRDAFDQIRDAGGAMCMEVFPCAVRKGTAVQVAQRRGLPVVVDAPESGVAQDYWIVTGELLGAMGVPDDGSPISTADWGGIDG